MWDFLSDFHSANDRDPGTVYKNISELGGREVEIIRTVTEVDPGQSTKKLGEEATEEMQKALEKL